MSGTKAFEGWAIVELMGHAVLAGYVTQESIAGTAMLRIDVPEVEGQPGFTKYQSGGSIYGITPTTEESARTAADNIKVRPVQLWIVPEAPQRKLTVTFRNDAAPYGDDARQRTRRRWRRLLGRGQRSARYRVVRGMGRSPDRPFFVA